MDDTTLAARMSEDVRRLTVEAETSGGASSVNIDEIMDVGRIDHRALAHRFELAGAYIRNAAVRAAFCAAAQGRRITMGDLLDPAERELEEMGRLAQRRLA